MNLGSGPPRAPCAPWQRKISNLPLHTPPNVGGSPQSQPFCQPSFSNHKKLSTIFETFSIGVSPSIFIALALYSRSEKPCSIIHRVCRWLFIDTRMRSFDTSRQEIPLKFVTLI